MKSSSYKLMIQVGFFSTTFFDLAHTIPIKCFEVYGCVCEKICFKMFKGCEYFLKALYNIVIFHVLTFSFTKVAVLRPNKKIHGFCFN